VIGAFVLGIAGCVLFVDTSDYGSSCQFQGQGTACGQCVAARCQAAVNDCCMASECSAAMGELDACATGQGCASLFGEPQRLGTEYALAQCVQTQCASVCSTVGTPQGGPVSCDNDPAFIAGAPSCTCVGVGGLGGACSPASLGDAGVGVLCCADNGYPTKANSACHCQTISCSDQGGTSTDCSCGLLLRLGKLASCTKKGPGYPCCQSTSAPNCHCSQSASCGNDEVDAGATCSTVMGLTCLAGSNQVSACSP
jgi:hypothetical protein